jgi:hypothetical protein
MRLRSDGPITPEMLDLFVRGDAGDPVARRQFNVLTKTPPWQIDVFAVDGIPEPAGGPEDYVEHPWVRSWWKARAFRDALDRVAKPR